MLFRENTTRHCIKMCEAKFGRNDQVETTFRLTINGSVLTTVLLTPASFLIYFLDPAG